MSNTEQNPSPVVKRAALIVTFYFQRDVITMTKPKKEGVAGQQKKLSPEEVVNYCLKEEWVPTFKLEQDKSKPNIWLHSATNTSLHYFTPSNRAANDTTVVQLIFDAEQQEQSVALAWFDDLWQRWRPALSETVQQNTIGYTLTFQAVLTGSELSDLTFNDLLPKRTLRTLHPSSLEQLDELAVTDIEKGRVWLIAIPLPLKEDKFLKHATIYLAVCPIADNNHFFKKALTGENAALFMPDLIAHKGYHQIRQYFGYQQETSYKQKVASIRKTSKEILVDPTTNDKFPEFRRDKQLLTGHVALFTALRISFAKQLYNYQLHIKRAGETEIGRYHDGQIQVVDEQLKLEIEEGQSVLQAAESAETLTLQYLEKAETRHQQLLSAIMAILAVVVTASGLIPPQTLAAFCASLTGTAITEPLNVVPFACLQWVITFFFACVAVKFVQWYTSKGVASD